MPARLNRSLLTGLIIASAATPALAAPPDAPPMAVAPPPPSSPRDPWAAVGLSAAGPLVLADVHQTTVRLNGAPTE